MFLFLWFSFPFLSSGIYAPPFLARHAGKTELQWTGQALGSLFPKMTSGPDDSFS